MVTLYIQNGQALPPRALARVMRDMEVGGLEHFFDNVSKTEAQVNEEHRIMMEDSIEGAQPMFEPDPNGAIDPRTLQPAMLPVTAGDGTPLFYALATNDFDEDELHLEFHYEFFRSPRYLEMLRGSKQDRDRAVCALGHAKLHEQKLQLAANNEAAAQMVMENTQGGQPPPLDPQSLNGGGSAVPSGPPLPGG